MDIGEINTIGKHCTFVPVSLCKIHLDEISILIEFICGISIGYDAESFGRYYESGIDKSVQNSELLIRTDRIIVACSQSADIHISDIKSRRRNELN